jgi:apurinic endonuclease APN1
MNVIGSIIHLGSFKNNGNGHEQLHENIAQVLEKAPEDRYFIIENAGNRKIGQTISEIGQIIKTLKDERLKVCLDTCHLHAAGYDLTTKESYDAFITMFEREVGLERLAVWHINDSHDPFGSLNDHHENLGKGLVGTDVFKNITHDPRMSEIPLILEVPGLDGKGPDKANIDVLKSLAQ